MSKTLEYNNHHPGLIRAWKMVAFAACISILMVFSVPSVQAAPAGSVLEKPALAQEIFRNPPLLPPRRKATPVTTQQNQPPDNKVFDLDIKYVKAELNNPAKRDPKDPSKPSYDTVLLRSYQGTGTSEKTPFVAPTIEAKPGDTVRINLNNKLPDQPSPDCKDSRDTTDENVLNCYNYNRTNLHSHGLWISPNGNSDNVLLTIEPGETFTYEYKIPRDHPAGTFWYHPHRHGSTAIQVASGMAGAFIVRGDRLPSESVNGDIDTLLNKAEIKERILVLQQIQYACLYENGEIKDKKDRKGKVVAWVCEPNEIGKIESYNRFFGPGTWGESGRYTSINGEILPTFKDAKAGEIERWRIIHGGVRATINLEFRKLKENPPNFNTLKTADADSYIGKNCTGDPIKYHVIADDGLTRSQAWQTTLTTLQPGYRSDALVVFPEAGKYCVVDASAPALGSVNAQGESRQLLGVVEVSVTQDEKEKYDIHGYLTDKLVEAAGNLSISTLLKENIVNDLKDDLKLSAFTPHTVIKDNEVKGNKQELTFFISNSPTKFEISNTLDTKDAQPYDHTRIDRKLKLGSADEWTLQSGAASHPFHIHVNPFQIVKISDKNNKDVSLPGAVDNFSGTNDPQYPGLKGVWKDTLFVKPNYTIVVRTRYQRYPGEFVIHCHILDHEDQGMMQNVSIVDPAKGAGTNTTSHQ
ncbi:multicopper oxidase, types 2 and 3 [Cylindrospermum sp. NIES-4074]|nr:multicopper oxidase, types 2 and 3 [Cylindrospermum sp. NIES-4074]